MNGIDKIVMKAFGCARLPFTNSIPCDAVVRFEQTGRLLGLLQICACTSSFMVVTAPPGCGKSAVLRLFRHSLDSREAQFIYIADSALTPRWLYNNALKSLGLEGRFYRGDGKRLLHEKLKSIRDCSGKKIVMVVDEAHLLDYETLEEVRFLLNAEDLDSGSPMALVLCGQEELWQKLGMERCQAIAQRIDYVGRLSPLSQEDAVKYIGAQISSAGFKSNPFTDEAAARIAERSGRVPRIINKICMHCLIHAITKGKEVIGPDMVKAILDNEIPECMLDR